ncbi:MAG: PspA/IM30 family protein [Myxococcales bacterium]|nr:PspA/IM30 family protein [Myxococcales bacterium]MCB9524669.1 PspA/IM30 family protein [Myxococcales bacterium]
MGFLNRMYNLWKGFLSIFVGRMEEKHPEIAYENAINGMTEKYAKLKSAAAGLIKHRAKLEASIEKNRAELSQIALDVETAVDQGEDEVAMVLLEKQGEVEAQLAQDEAELARAAKDAESAKDSLREIKVEIDKLKREKDRVVAQIKDAEARKHIQEQLDGLSVDDEVKALDNVREYADKVRAEVQIGDELKEDSIDAKLKAIRTKSGSSAAKAKLAALKAQRAAAEGDKSL